MDKQAILKPLQDLNKGLQGLDKILHTLKDSLPKDLPKEEAEKIAEQVKESGIVERVQEMQERINKIR